MEEPTTSDLPEFLELLSKLKSGFSTGHYDGKPYSVTIERKLGGRVTKLFAEELGGTNFVSFNLFQTKEQENVLKPCEMPAEKVIDFVKRFQESDSDATEVAPKPKA